MVGVEGTGSYGAGIARFLARAGVHVVEVDRQNRQARHHSGKSDPLDAVEAARAAQSGRARGTAKSRGGSVEAIRVLVVAKRLARGARIKALGQMGQLTFSPPDQLQSRRGASGATVRSPTGLVDTRRRKPGPTPISNRHPTSSLGGSRRCLWPCRILPPTGAPDLHPPGGTVTMDDSADRTANGREVSCRLTTRTAGRGRCDVLRSLQPGEFDLCGSTRGLNGETLP